MHPGESVNRQESVQNPNHEKVQMVGTTLFESVSEWEMEKEAKRRVSLGSDSRVAHNMRSRMRNDRILIAWIVNHCLCDVLIHKNEQGESESQAHGREGSRQRQILDVSSFNG